MKNVIKLYEDVKAMIINPSFDKDVHSFTKGNKTAGRRVRGVLQKVKKLSQDLRVEVQNQKAQAEKALKLHKK